MSCIERRLLLIFRGSPDQTRLDQLRQALGLRSHGRLTDTEDARFGSGDVTIAGVPAVLTLWRSQDDLWSIVIDADSGAVIADSDLADWQSLAESAASDAGWTLVERRSFH